MRLIKSIQNFAFQNDLWEKDTKIVLGVSGGPDSVFLLDFFAHIAPKYDLKLHIAHVNYSLRGKDSEKDEAFVRRLGEKYDIEVSVLKTKKAQYRGNLENSLRNIRYEFFEDTRKKLGFDLIAVAHTMDDQAETVLMRILRGSGLNGLGAMKPKSGNIIRPLLQTGRNVMVAYLKQKGLVFRTDLSNLDTKLTRNRIRHELIPFLEKNFNPSVKKTLSEWSAIVADDYDFIEKNAERFAKAACKSKEECFVFCARSKALRARSTTIPSPENKCATFSGENFEKLHPSMRRQVLRIIIKNIKGKTEDIENKQVEEMLKVLKSTKSKPQTAFIAGLKILKKGDRVEIIPA